MSRHRLAPCLLALALAAAVPLAACGDDDDDGNGTAATTATQPAGAGDIALTDAPEAAPPAARPSALVPKAHGPSRVGYCSPSGDYCLGVRASGDSVLLSIGTFAFRGRYRLCVSGPPGRGCKTFSLRRRGQVYASTIRFKPPVAGRYSATWFYGRTRLARTLAFRAS